MVQCSHASAFNEENQALNFVYSLWFVTVKDNEDGNDIHKESFRIIPYFTKSILRANGLQNGSVM